MCDKLLQTWDLYLFQHNVALKQCLLYRNTKFIDIYVIECINVLYAAVSTVVVLANFLYVLQLATPSVLLTWSSDKQT